MWWITGANGLLGKEISAFFGENNVECYLTDFNVDITKERSILNFLKDRKITGIINCAAYTNVEECEECPIDHVNVNMIGAYNLALVAKKFDVPIIHFSTDYVFSGTSKRPYQESDITGPINKYGLSKLYSENYIMTNSDKYFIFRISWLYGRFGSSFVNKVMDKIMAFEDLKIVDDQVGSLTNAFDVAKLVYALAVQPVDKYGVYHFTGYGAASWFDIAKFIGRCMFSMGIVSREPKVEPISSWAANLKAKRPVYSYLDKSKIENELGIASADWKDSLVGYIINRYEHVYRSDW